MKIRERKIVVSLFLFFLLSFAFLTVGALPQRIQAETALLNDATTVSSAFWTENDKDVQIGNGAKSGAKRIDDLSLVSADSALSWIWDAKLTTFADKISSDAPQEYTFGEYFALKGAFINYNKLDPNNSNRIIYSASFDVTDNAKEDLLLEFLPVPYGKPDLSSATPNHRNIGIKLADDKDDSRSVTLYYDVIAQNATAATLKVQQGGTYGAAPSGLEAHYITVLPILRWPIRRKSIMTRRKRPFTRIPLLKTEIHIRCRQRRRFLNLRTARAFRIRFI